MVVFGISGGAFYLRAQMTAVYYAHRVYDCKADAFIGTSAGAIISAVSAICGVEKAWQIANNINPKDAISGNPFGKDGELSFISKTKPIFGCFPVKLNVIDILDAIIDQKSYNDWRANIYRKACFVTTADIEQGKRKIWDLSKLDREEAILKIQASCSMQGINAPVLLGDNLHWDGGQFDHNPLHLIFDHEQYGIPDLNPTKIVAIWSRPNKWQAEYKDLKKAGYFTMLQRMIELDNIEKSNNDQQRLEEKCAKSNIKPIQIFIERVLANFYDSSEQGQSAAVQAAIKATNEAFKV